MHDLVAVHSVILAVGNMMICRFVDVATGKRRTKSADAKCGWVGKLSMCG